MTKLHHSKALILRSIIVWLIGAFMLGLGRPLPARAATLTVSDCSAPSGAAGRLVEVINAATWGDTINFSCSGTITLSSTITLDKNLTIDGTGQSVTISGGGAVRVFYADGLSNPDVAVTLNHLTITNGFADQGAGLYNVNVLLTVTNSTLSGNHATLFGGGIFNETNGRLDVTNSTLWGNSADYDGGGIRNSRGRVWVTNSTLSGNSATNGGGIANSWGAVIAVNSTLSGNTVTGNGGSLYNFGTGATFDFYSTILAKTPSGLDCNNTGGAQIVYNDHNLVEDGSCSDYSAFFKTGDPLLGPLGDNGGATWTMALAPGSPAIDAGYDLMCEWSPVYNLDQRGIVRPQGAHCDIGAYESRGFTLTKSGGDNQSTPINTAFTNPLSATLSETGGSGLPGVVITFTAPSSGASANLSSPTATTASSGNASVTAQTANGLVGDYTVTASATGATSVNFALTNSCVNAVTVTSNADSGAGTLRQAITNACAGGTITFSGDYTITLTSGELAIAKNLTIDGSGHQITVSGNNATRVFNIGGGNVTLNALNIIKGSVSGTSGGGLWNSGALTINNSTFSNNTATYAGAGIYNAPSASLSITNSTFADNHGGAEGNGVTNYGTLTVMNATFSGNGGSVGGNLYNGATATLNNTLVAASSAGGNCSGNAFAAGSANNLSDDATCSGGFTPSANLALGSLGDNGGSTPTLALGPDSAAIDAADSASCPVTDQRGQPRADLRCDIGAYELKYADSHTVIRSVSSTTMTLFGPALIGLQRDPSVDPGAITATKSLTWKTKPANAIDAYWSITPTVDSGLNLTLTLCYTPTESNGLNLNALTFWKFSAGTWVAVPGTPVTSTVGINSCATLTGVNTLSTWTLATSQPTAVNLQAFSAQAEMPAMFLPLLALIATSALVIARRRQGP